MGITTLKNWNGEHIEAIQTTGGVWAFPTFGSGVIRVPECPFPPPELLQKLCGSDKQKHFHADDQTGIISKLGHYSDLQSVHSEDAMVWSYFGTLAYSQSRARVTWADWLAGSLGYAMRNEACTVSLWRRVPHPDNLTPNGPEIDALIQTDKMVIIVEAKWRSGEGLWQGCDAKTPQLELRKRFVRVLGKRLFGDRSVIVLSVVLEKNPGFRPTEGDVDLREVTWKALVNEAPHPMSDEIRRYYDWKRNLIARKPGVPAPG